MTASRIALAAAVVAAALWAAKSVAIGTAGGLDRSPLESPLFVAGLSAFVVSCVALGLALTRERAPWVRALTGALAAPAVGVAATIAVVWLVDAAAEPTPHRHWVWAEVNLWVIAVAALALAVLARRREAG